MEHKLSQSEAHINNSDQYNRRNNFEIQGIPSNVSKGTLDSNVLYIFPKNTIVRPDDRKFCYEALDEKLNFRKKDSAQLGFQAGAVLYFSENLTLHNQRLTWKCRELKTAGKIYSPWSSKGIDVEAHHK